jgi:predicted phosphoribosyltransferase
LQLAANSTPQSTKETQQVIFIDEGQEAVRSRVQAVKAIAQREVSAIVAKTPLPPVEVGLQNYAKL